MRINWLIIWMLACIFWSSCKSSNEPQCLALPLAAVILSANVRIVDKTTGADLFLSPTSPYKLSDLEITSSLTGTNINFFVDSANKDKRFIGIMGNNSQRFILKLAALSADTINMSILVTHGRCYDTQTVSAITLNNTRVCGPCSFDDLVTIKK
jgi:hypothetical protein